MVVAVSGPTDRLTYLVTRENLSSIEVMSKELGLGQDEIRTMLQELIGQGVLKGRITEDGLRFFQDGIRVSEQTSVSPHEMEPEFMRFNTKPGRYTAGIGLVVTAISYLTLVVAGGNVDVENIAIAVMLVGIMLLMAGCYCVGRRKTPS